MKFFAIFSDPAYVLLRVMAGSMFFCHGAQKLFGLFGGKQILNWSHLLTGHPVQYQMWIGGFIELLGGMAIAIGLFTRFWAFICSGMMAVAYFQFHWKFHPALKFFPIVNGGELAVLYCFVFLLIACNGGVKWCMDKS